LWLRVGVVVVLVMAVAEAVRVVYKLELLL
jgi:hypothetical protein